MSPEHQRRAITASAIASLVSLLVGGGVAAPAEAASATIAARASAIRCVGDTSVSTARRGSVPYTSLDGSTFSARTADAGGKVVTIGAAGIRLHDFTPDGGTLDGGVVASGAGGLVGAGASRSIIALAPHSSTRKSDVPKRFPQTNQLSVLRVTGSADLLSGFTVRATAQGHPYNGLRVERVRNLRASRLRVIGVSGTDIQPPGETFAINDYRTVGSRWSHIVVDGKGVGASGLGVNSSKHIVICDAVSRRNAKAMGFAFWQSSSIRLVDCAAVDNGFSGFNFERTSGSVVMIRPVAHGNRYDMRIASDRSSATFRIVDPKLVDGHWTVWLPRRWYGATNRQRAADITLIVHGRSRPDLLRIRRY